MPSSATSTVAVIGGGLTGISAALSLSEAGHHVHLFEATDRLGGKIGETQVDGRTIPTGPDAFLARRAEVIDLATSLGLADKLVTPSAGSARIYRNGALHQLPPNVLGVPATAELGATGLISPEGAARALQDASAPDDRPEGDESVGDLVRRRLGDEVHEYLVDPLLGGINAGDSDRLSLVSGVPQLATLRAKHHSLLSAASQTLAQAPAKPAPVFNSIAGGLSRLIEQAEAELMSQGVELHLGEAATIQHNSRWSVSSLDVNHLDVDHVVLTTPAFASAKLVKDIAPTTAKLLDSIDYSSVALAILVLPPDTIDIDRTISGVLVPRLCGLHITAVSFASHKWPVLAPDGSQILRVSVGRRTDDRWTHLQDAEILGAVRHDLAEVFGTLVPEGPSVLTRWMKSLPQYDVHHAETIAAIDKSTAHLDSLTLTGAWRNGLGLPACVAAGQVSISTPR